MNKLIYNLLRNLISNNSKFRSFISFYLEKKLFEDLNFLEFIKLPYKNLSYEKINLNNDYLKFLEDYKLDFEESFILLNDNFFLNDNLKSNVFIEKIDKDFFLKNKLEEHRFIYDNLNLFYILSHLVSTNNLYIKILKNFKNNKNFNIIHLYDKNISNYSLFTNIFIDVPEKIYINVNDIYLNYSENSFIGNNTILYLKNSSIMNYNLINISIYDLFSSTSVFSFQNSNSKLDFKDFFTGNCFSKNFYNFYLSEYAILKKNSIKKLSKNSILDIKSNVLHYAKNTKSDIFFRSVNNDSSKCIFQGNIKVDIDTNFVEAFLKCDGLILNSSAEIKFLPELDIENGNIKCSHGSTIGCVDEKVLFYMMCKGLNKDQCIYIIICSFLSLFIEKNEFIYKLLSNDMINKYFLF